MQDKWFYSYPVAKFKRVPAKKTPPPKDPEDSATDMLPFSGAELEQQLRDQALANISEGQKKLMNDERERKIRVHYEERASKLMHGIWKECRKRTKHHDRDPKGSGYSQYQCNTCNAPLRNTEGKYVLDNHRSKMGISEVGKKLRNADVKAGIEWIP